MAVPSDAPGLDALAKLFVQALDQSIKREIAEEDLVRDEIKRRGTYWAGSEIWKLRRRVASLERQLAERQQ